MYELANEAMNTRQITDARQIKVLIYHDPEVCNDVVKENTEVCGYLPRNKRDKLSLKWTGPVRIIKEKHPSYLIEYQNQGKMVTKWTTREKLRRTEQNQNDIYNEQNNTLILDNESSVVSNEEKIMIPRYNKRYNLRQDIRVPQRYDNVYTHLVNIYHGKSVPENLPNIGEGCYDL